MRTGCAAYLVNFSWWVYYFIPNHDGHFPRGVPIRAFGEAKDAATWMLRERDVIDTLVSRGRRTAGPCQGCLVCVARGYEEQLCIPFDDMSPVRQDDYWRVLNWGDEGLNLWGLTREVEH